MPEGTTYKSRVDLDTNAHEMDTDEIPDPIKEHIPLQIEGSSYDSGKVIYFDLETTSLGKDCDIVQVAACCGISRFSAYVQCANQEISTIAQEITGLHFDSTGTLYHNGVEVESVQLENALDQFLRVASIPQAWDINGSQLQSFLFLYALLGIYTMQSK